jgi:HD-GYP domain-containing protein (c-di-GMP phosphodiesterase class II)
VRSREGPFWVHQIAAGLRTVRPTALTSEVIERSSVSDPGVLDRMHAVGKAAVPDTILNKPGPLNEEEWQLMRRHTLIGE